MKILSLSGGGTAGYGTALFLNKLEQEAGKPLAQIFDMVCGVSVGSIVGAAVALQVPMRELVDKLYVNTPKIFVRRPMQFWRGLTTPKYDIADLRDVAYSKLFESATMSSCVTKFMAHAVATNPIKPVFWKSWENQHELLADICTRSAAAPVYFQPYQGYVDGGLASNDPSMPALAEAVKLSGSLADIRILNVRPHPIGGSAATSKIRNILHWAETLPVLAISANEKSSEYEAHQLIGWNHHVIDLNIISPIDAWNPQFEKLCTSAANQAFTKHLPAIKERFNV